MKICAFFGHRDAYSVDVDKLEALIDQAVHEYGCTAFWCGGYGAFDHVAAQTVRRMKDRYPQIRLVLVYAYLPVEKDPRAELYDETFLPDGLETVPKRFAISRRNEWIARHCDLAIACINFPYGGAYQACKKILHQNKPILNLGSLPLTH